MAPSNSARVLVGFENVWRSTDPGDSWTRIAALRTFSYEAEPESPDLNSLDLISCQVLDLSDKCGCSCTEGLRISGDH